MIIRMNKKLFLITALAGVSLIGCSANSSPEPEVFSYSDPDSISLPMGSKTIKCEKIDPEQFVNLGATYDPDTGWSCFWK